MPPFQTSEQILDHLRANPIATAQEIAQSLNLGAPAVRYHLRQLVRDGWVVVIQESVPGTKSRGRPQRSYQLASRAKPHNLAVLSSLLLSEQLRTAPSAEAFWKTLAEITLATMPLPAQFTRRLARLIDELKKMNYDARWEAGPSGPRIFLKNCPYAEIWPKFTGLCSMDRFLLEHGLGRKFEQTARIGQAGAAAKACIFEPRPGRK